MRYMRVRIHAQLLMDMFTQDYEIHAKCIKGLPMNARFCYTIASTHYIWLDMVFEHPSFEVVMMGHEIPMFPDPVFEKIS